MKFNPRSAALAGAVAAVAVSGALLAGPVFADDSATTSNGLSALPSSGQSMPDFDGDGPHSDSATVGMHGRDHGGPMGGAFGGPMLHSEGVVAKTDTSGTTYVTVRSQSGKVTAASDTSITVKSDDGYTRTWAIGSSTAVRKDGTTVKASSFAVGDVVMVSGTVDGSAVTTTFVGSGGMRGGNDGRGHGMGGHGGRGHGMGGDDDMNGAGGNSGATLAPVPSTSANTNA